MMVYLFFYSAKDLMHFAVVFFVVAADLANERHQYKEATTDDSNHNLNRHVMQVVSGKRFSLGLLLFSVGRAMLDGIQAKAECPTVRQQRFDSHTFSANRHALDADAPIAIQQVFLQQLLLMG
jgi:hypothetical protein